MTKTTYCPATRIAISWFSTGKGVLHPVDQTGRDEIDTIHRRQAQSGRVSYGDPVIPYESSKTRQVMIPFFVPRSDGTDLAVKTVTYRKAPSPIDWVTNEQKTLSLHEEAARSLLVGLKKYLAVADGNGDGDYIVIKILNGAAQLSGLEPDAVAQAIFGLLSRKDIASHLDAKELSSEIVSAFRTSIRLHR